MLTEEKPEVTYVAIWKQLDTDPNLVIWQVASSDERKATEALCGYIKEQLQGSLGVQLANLGVVSDASAVLNLIEIGDLDTAISQFNVIGHKQIMFDVEILDCPVLR